MKIGIVGIGAVGGYFGAKLAKAGQDVTFIGKENITEHIKEHGLKIISYQGDFEIKKPKAAHPFEAVKDVDLILFCVKSYSTRKVAEALNKRISDKAVIISVQNGIENEKILAEIFGRERVIGSTVYVSAAVSAPGIIKHTAYGKIVLGELTGEITPRLRKIEKLFLDSSIPAGVTDDINKTLWKKLILNIAYNGFTSVINNTLVKFPEVLIAQECFYEVMKEAQAVANEEGIKITDNDIDDLMKVTKSEGFTTFKTSTLQDIEAEKPLEIDDINGIIIKLANKHNIKVPMNKLLYALLKLKN
ncbi:MAG: ketopantoate reductase family protein [Candidatus Gastranaerophilaceae bacterium]|jgi:2-dehydropantoate 2-reductase